jgi:hypothetical protein
MKLKKRWYLGRRHSGMKMPPPTPCTVDQFYALVAWVKSVGTPIGKQEPNE